MYSIILAGGSGSRLWPLSREMCPKQLLNIQNNESLLQETFERLASFIPAENIISITNTNIFLMLNINFLHLLKILKFYQNL